MVELFFPVFYTLSHITTLEEALVILIRGLSDLLLGHWLSALRGQLVDENQGWSESTILELCFSMIWNYVPQFSTVFFTCFSLTWCFFCWVQAPLHHRISTVRLQFRDPTDPEKWLEVEPLPKKLGWLGRTGGFLFSKGSHPFPNSFSIPIIDIMM